ncbi:hypothetical protein [Streptomyces asiaticus]|uniref:hypothetical protein n=1 Tax=Streptomyces asiaticus TaxID=114695 RepID=UPI003F674964
MPTTYYPYDNGTVGPTGPEGPQGPAGPAGANGVIHSINGKSAAEITLTADDVNALARNANAQLDAQYLWLNTAAGTYRAFGWKTAGVDRWLMQVDDQAETGSAAGSNFRLASRNDDGSFNKTVLYASRASGQIGFSTTALHGSAAITSAGPIGLRDVSADPATTSGGAFLYAKSGVMYVKQADGTSFQIQSISYPVTSVNGEAGNVTLGADDVEALSTATGGTVNGAVTINGKTGTARELSFGTNGVKRWSIQAEAAAEEGGVDSGSNFRIVSHTDDGSAKATAMYVNRETGQTIFGDGAAVGGARATTAGPHGFGNVTAEPAADPNGFQLYAADGKPMIKQGDGTVFQVGPGGSGGCGAVDSVNGQTGIVTITAEELGAIVKNSEYFQEATRAIFQGDGTNNIMEWRDQSGSLVSRIGADGSLIGQGPIYGAGGLQLGSTSADFGGGSGAILAMTEVSTAPTSNPASGIVAYVEGGVLKYRKPDGTIVIPGTQAVLSVNGQGGNVAIDLDSLGGVAWADRGVANGVASLDSSTKVPVAQLPDLAVPSSFTPESLGLKAWAGDPDYCASGNDFCGVGAGRMTAVYVNRTVTVSKIVWHVFGYAGGLKTGSWAGIYNTSGALQRATGDMSTAAYEPAQQHDTGGGWSSSNLTSSVTLSPGVYYVLWRFNYTASPADGPALARFESSAACQSVMGVNNKIWRHASYATSATSAPSSIAIGSLQRDSIRFWVGLT